MSAHGASLPGERLKSARLMVSELVTNACKHGEGRIELIVVSSDDGVRAEVHDEGEPAAFAPATSRPARGGWGLQFVDRLSDGWGVEDGETRVWFSVASHAAP